MADETDKDTTGDLHDEGPVTTSDARDRLLLAYVTPARGELSLATPAGLTPEEAAQLRMRFTLEHPSLAVWLAGRSAA